ncbi:MAG: hypothetical protein DMG88_05110 [Acidobacteria bacterium]|nr:MAG: hypothetical protein DMG88_05110 [Acidobacteriota bacterium]
MSSSCSACACHRNTHRGAVLSLTLPD